MFVRAWVFAITIGLIAGLALAQEPTAPLESQPVPDQRQSETEAASDNQGQDEQPQSADPTPALRSIEAAIRELIAEQDQIKSERQFEREIRDLNAQEDMALSAKRMFEATVATVVLTALALLVLVLTLCQTRRAANSARIMTDEARKSTFAATELVRLETQPFLTIELIDGHKYRIKDGVIGVYGINGFHEHPLQFRIVNGGRSSAISTKIFRRWEFAEKGADPCMIDRSVTHVESPLERLTKITIPVGPQSCSPAITTYSDQIEGAGTPYTYFHGFIEFSDTSGKQRGRTGFCYIYVDWLGERGFHVAMPEDAGQHWYHERLED